MPAHTSSHQYGIIRVQKVKSAAVHAMRYHNDRLPGKHSNKDIDPERTHLNVEYVPHGEYETEVQRRIDEYRESTRKVRKDAVVLVEGIVTASPEFFKGLTDEDKKEFFDDCFEFVKEEAGAENMVHFTVHMDETTPHAHFGFTPIKDGALSWKKFFDGRDGLRGYQDRFHERVGKSWGLERGERNDEKNPKRHKSTEQMKRDSQRELKGLQEEVRKQKSLSAQLGNEIANLQTDVQRTQQLRAQLNDEVANESASAQRLRDEVANLTAQCEKLARQNSSLASENDELGNKNAQLSNANNELKDANAKLSRANDSLQRANGELERKLSEQRERSADLENRISKLERMQSRLQSDVKRLQNFAQNLKQDALNTIREVKEIADSLHLRPFLGSWKDALQNLANLRGNSIAREAGQAAGGWSRQWNERDARKGDKVIERNVRSVKELADELAEKQESLEEDIERYEPQSLADLTGEMRESARGYNRESGRGSGFDYDR